MTKLPQQIEIALQDVALATAGNLGILDDAAHGNQRPRLGNGVYGTFGDSFATLDGHHVMVTALTPCHWADLVELTGVGSVVSGLEVSLDTDFSDEGERYLRRDLLNAVISPWFATRTLEAVEAGLGRTRVIWSRFRSFGDVVADVRNGNERSKVLQHRQDGPDVELRTLSVVRVNGHHADVGPAPRLGEHTDELLDNRQTDGRVADACDPRAGDACV